MLAVLIARYQYPLLCSLTGRLCSHKIVMIAFFFSCQFLFVFMRERISLVILHRPLRTWLIHLDFNFCPICIYPFRIDRVTWWRGSSTFLPFRHVPQAFDHREEFFLASS